MPVRVYQGDNPLDGLKRLADLAQKEALQEQVQKAALRIIGSCASRDDECELEAIFEAVKNGTPAIPGLSRGFKYVSDPLWADYFRSARKILDFLKLGANGGDCDCHTSLIMSLGAAIGFRMGARVWAAAKGADFEHVYAVALLPKLPPYKEIVGMDTTVEESYLGWQPDRGDVLTAWIAPG